MKASIPSTTDGLQALVRDAARLSAAYGGLLDAWRAEQAAGRSPDDEHRRWRGWLGFCVLSAYVAALADPSRPPDEGELAPLRETFSDAAVREVVLGYYFGTEEPAAHRDPDDLRALAALADAHATRGLTSQGAGDEPWAWELHRVGTSAMVLRATPPDDHLSPVAVKVVVPPYLEWADIREATKASGRDNVESEALARTHAATEAVLVTSFVEGRTLAEALADRDARRRASGATMLDVDAGSVRFAIDTWLPVVRALAELDADLPGTGHGDLNPSNVILTGRKAVFVDLGTSHLLQANPGTGTQTVRRLSRHTAPELLESGGVGVDRRKADLYSLGDLLLDALVPEGPDANERVERIYGYSFELGQLVDTLRSYDPDLRIAVHRPTGRPFGLAAFVGAADRILVAADALAGTGLRDYRLSNIVWRQPRFPDPATRPTGPEDRVATLGSREPWPIHWFRAARLIAQLGGTVIVGLALTAVVGCQLPFAPGVCDARDILGGPTGFLGLGDDPTHRLGVFALGLTWLFVVHCYYTRIFAQLRPALCRPLAYRRASEAVMRFVAVPGHLAVGATVLAPDTWWLWGGMGALVGGLNNVLFTRFLRSGIAHLRASASGPAARDSLAAAADAVDEYVTREYGKWATQMGIYGVGMLAMGGWLAITRIVLADNGLAPTEVDDATAFVEWTLITICIIVNLIMLYRNCSEMGQKAPELRANGARIIAGCLRLVAAEQAPHPSPDVTPEPAERPDEEATPPPPPAACPVLAERR